MIAIYVSGIYQAEVWAIALGAIALFVEPKAKGGTSKAEKEMRALQDCELQTVSQWFARFSSVARRGDYL